MVPSDDKTWTWRPSGRTKWPPGSCHSQDEQERVCVWADECAQHLTHWLFVSFFLQSTEWVVIWRRLLGQLSDILGIAVIGTAQQQDVGRFGALGRGEEGDGCP